MSDQISSFSNSIYFVETKRRNQLEQVEVIYAVLIILPLIWFLPLPLHLTDVQVMKGTYDEE